MVSIVWKQSYEISYLMASLSLLFYCILDKKSDFNILTDIFGLVAQAKSACGGDEVGHSACFRCHKPRLSRPWFSFGGSKLWFGGSKRNDGPHLKVGKANDRADYSASIRS